MGQINKEEGSNEELMGKSMETDVEQGSKCTEEIPILNKEGMDNVLYVAKEMNAQ